MRWQSQRDLIDRDRISGQAAIVVGLMATGSAMALALGWGNFVAITLHGPEAKISFLDLADEQFSILNFLQPCALIVASIICRASARIESAVNRRAFVFLSIGFILLAVGETFVGSHSIYIDWLSSTFRASSPAAIILPLFVVPVGSGLYLSRFLMRLPKRYAVGFALSGCTYVLGVLGFEIISQTIAARYGAVSLGYFATAGIEETLETLGIVGFLLTASSYMRALCPRVYTIDL